MWYLVLVVVGIAGAVWYALHRSSSDGSTAASQAANTNRVWSRSGAYACEVVGESHYQDALRAAAKTLERHADTPLLAVLTPEQDNPHDRNAVSVRIAGHTVGYLPRDLAPRYRRLLEREGVGMQPVCAYARITGGFDLGDGTRAHLGIELDVADLEKN